MSRPNIVLTGFMGTGKTTIGQLIARQTTREFVDTDEQIIAKTGRSIADIFTVEGETTFRQMEREIARKLAGRENLAIATGGRLMVDPLNALLLGQNSIVICLNAEPNEIIDRLKNHLLRRPLLEVPDPAHQVKQLLDERSEAYGQFHQIVTSGKDPESITSEIIELIRHLEKSGDWRGSLPSRIPVRYPGGRYSVTVGRDLLSQLDKSLDLSGPFAIVTDDNVGPLYLEKLASLDPIAKITVPAGEEYKTLKSVRMIYDRLLSNGIDRNSTIIALGGGVVGDMAGFAAATYMRGVRFIQCPTTVLAMVDASVGGKTGVDLPQGKNLIGAFKQPHAVIADLDTLATLPAVELSAGMAEVIKSGLIASPPLLEGLRRMLQDRRSNGAARYIIGDGQPTPLALNWPATSSSMAFSDIQLLIVESILIKRDIVEVDPFESGLRKTLNLGHTFAHAIEQVSNFQVRHGQAVAMGLVAASKLSGKLGHCSPEIQGHIESLLDPLDLPKRVPGNLSPDKIITAMGKDKKKTKNKLNFVLIREIGDVFVSDQVPEKFVRQTLVDLQSN
jgi:shikimate kinase/3-dehydroquinate synthase